MIIKKGQDGVTHMFNAHTKTKWDSMFIHKRLKIRGPITTEGSAINLGYNEVIACESPELATKLATNIMNDLNR